VITAVNAAGESARSTEASAALAPPSIPPNLATQGGITQIALAWGATSGASSYKVYRGTSPGGENATPIATNLTTTSFTDTGLSFGATFYYQVSAVNGLGESSRSTEVSATTVIAPAHIVVVVESHFDVANVITEDGANAPYINSLADAGALFNSATAITYPGQPNYLGLFSGSTQGVTSDTVPSSQFSTDNLGSELIAAGLTFTGYAEGLPSAGSLVNSAGTTDSAGNQVYQRYHNPWSDFSNVPAADNQPLTAFPTNFASLPTVSFVVPNFMDDMHDGTITQGDTWLQTNLGAYATWAMTHNSLLVVTWDDDVTGSNPNQIATIIYGQQVQAGTFADSINHYSTLRTIEDLYGVTRLGSAATASTIQDSWHAVPLTPPAPGSLQASAAGVQQISLTWNGRTGATN
jgi:acid phosphatase